MKFNSFSAIFASAILLAGCVTNSYTDAPSKMGALYSRYAYVAYDGPIKPANEVGIVTTDGLIAIKYLNGQTMNNFTLYKSRGFYSGGRYQLHLLPGTYELVMGFHYDKGQGFKTWSTTDVKKTIAISAGQVRHLSVEQGWRSWSVLESDGSKALATIQEDFQELLSKQD